MMNSKEALLSAMKNKRMAAQGMAKMHPGMGMKGEAENSVNAEVAPPSSVSKLNSPEEGVEKFAKGGEVDITGDNGESIGGEKVQGAMDHKHMTEVGDNIKAPEAREDMYPQNVNESGMAGGLSKKMAPHQSVPENMQSKKPLVPSSTNENIAGDEDKEPMKKSKGLAKADRMLDKKYGRKY